MNRNRSCPGVPNRYSHRLPGSAIRPKSIATVVVVLVAPASPASSTPSECSVIAASVVSGSMSEIEPMNVVLPTAKPPAMTIFTTVGAAGISDAECRGAGIGEPGGTTTGAPPGGTPYSSLPELVRSECADAIEDTLQNAERGDR